jgi:hypothetical protein
MTTAEKQLTVTAEDIQSRMQQNQLKSRKDVPIRTVVLIYDNNGRTPAVHKAYGGPCYLAQNISVIAGVKALGQPDFYLKVFRPNIETGALDLAFGCRAQAFKAGYATDRAMITWMRCLMANEGRTGSYVMKIDMEEQGDWAAFVKTRKEYRKIFTQDRSRESVNGLFDKYLASAESGVAKPSVKTHRIFLKEELTGETEVVKMNRNILVTLMTTSLAAITRDLLPGVPGYFQIQAEKVIEAVNKKDSQNVEDVLRLAVEKVANRVRNAAKEYAQKEYESAILRKGIADDDQRAKDAAQSLAVQASSLVERVTNLRLDRALAAIVKNRVDADEQCIEMARPSGSVPEGVHPLLTLLTGMPVQAFEGQGAPWLGNSWAEIVEKF